MAVTLVDIGVAVRAWPLPVGADAASDITMEAAVNRDYPNQVHSLRGLLATAIALVENETLIVELPEPIEDECIRLVVGYLWDKPSYEGNTRIPYVWRNCGAASLVAPFRHHRANPLGQASGTPRIPLPTPQFESLAVHTFIASDDEGADREGLRTFHRYVVLDNGNPRFTVLHDGLTQTHRNRCVELPAGYKLAEVYTNLGVAWPLASFPWNRNGQVWCYEYFSLEETITRYGYARFRNAHTIQVEIQKETL